MKKLAVCLILGLLMGMDAPASAQPAKPALVLVKDGHSDYRIVVPQGATESEKRAAEELHDFIKQISGADLIVVADEPPITAHEIILGHNRHLSQIGIPVEFEKLGIEGFTIRTAGTRLVIAGGTGMGTLYGVYTFLEQHLGCRWYTPGVSHIPTTREVALGNIDDTQIPAMRYRDVYYAEAGDRTFATRLKLNNAIVSVPSTDPVPEGVLPGLGWCHTLFTLIPPDKYFTDHPEYFAFRDGKRVATQPCLTNPEVLRIVVENLKKLMDADPKLQYWGVSQMDNGEPCACEKCKAIDDREGSPSGSLLEFVNQVAARFPDKVISTLAYWYTMAPPKTVRPASNVHIMFCIDVDHSPPYYQWFEGWSKISPRMYIWYYVIPCHNFIAPWPNLHLLQPQIADFAAHGASGMFIEGGYNAGSEFAELRTYLLAKILWNPKCDAEALIDDFLKGYYGPAAAPLRKYIDEMRDSAKSTGAILNGHTWSRNFAGGFLATPMLARYDVLFDEAEQSVIDQPDLLLRVQHARMPLMHAELQLGYGSLASRVALADRLRDYAVRSHTEFFADFNQRPTEQYLSQLKRDLEQEQTAASQPAK